MATRHRDLIVTRAARHKLPAVYVGRWFANLPVQSATKHQTVINLKTAKALALTIPHSVLARADEVLE